MKGLTLLFLIPFVTLAQTYNAKPPGGMSAFVSFLNNNINFAGKVAEQDMSGLIKVEFRVNDSGKLDSFNIVDDIGEGTGVELVKAIKKGGDWIPAMKDGKPVASWIELPYTVPGDKQSSEQSTASGMVSAEPEIGIEEFRKKFLNYFKYPNEAISAGVQGTFTLRFVVKEDGSVTSVRLKDDPGYGVLESATRALRKAGKWKPMTKDSKYYKAESTFEFTLNLKEFKRGIY